MMEQNLHFPLMLDSYLVAKKVFSDNSYIAGYAFVQKRQCEIANFISATLRVLRFIEGESEWLVNGKVLRFRAGDVVVFSNLCRRNIHRILSEKVTYQLYDFFPGLLSGSELWQVFYSDTHIMVRQGDSGSDRVYTLLDFLHGEMLSGENTPYRVQFIRNLINLLAIEFTRRHASVAENIPDVVFRISESTQYISAHLAEKLDLHSLARRCGYTPEYYSKIFKKCTGMTPKQFIINTRIDNALHLIRNNHSSVLEAAFASGFQSSAAFYKSFKLYRGVPPHQFLVSQPDEGQDNTQN